MIITDTLAWNEMCARVREAAEGSVAAIVGYAPAIYYADQKNDAPPINKLYVRMSRYAAGPKKRTLGATPRITQHGLLELEIMIPVGGTRAAELALRVSAAFKSVFAYSTANVDFTSALIRDMPRDAQWFIKRVQCDYTYDTRD